MHPILCKIGPFTLYTYGFFAGVAMVSALIFSSKRALQYGFSPSRISDIVFLLFITGIIGARLFYALQHWTEFADSPFRVLAIYEGGLVWYGGFIFASVTGLLYAYFLKMPVFKLCDMFAPVLTLGHGIGRIGCFFNGCCYGSLTSFGRHPVQLYEAAFLFALTFFLLKLEKKEHREGDIFLIYLMSYSLFRFLIEFLRGDQLRIYHFTLPQWTSLLLFTGVLVLYFRPKGTKAV